MFAAPLVSGPSNITADRRPASVRRTSTIDMRWPDGWGTPTQVLGRARDLLTPPSGGEATVLAKDVIRARVALDRTIEAITCDPARVDLAPLVGARCGGKLRGRLAQVVPDELSAGTPLYLLLDDLAGATLVGRFAYSQWPDLWPEEWRRPESGREPQRRMEGICIGFTPGSSALDTSRRTRFIHDVRRVEPLPATDDPHGWHELPSIADVSMRRARRIDVRLTDVIEATAFFQDSATSPDGGRIAVHEYLVSATADRRTGRLLSVEADPRVLPFRECPRATGNIERLVGTPMFRLRDAVIEELRGTLGCTHLNDTLRALAEVPVLARALQDAGQP